jgi:hypothetical protein
MTVQTIDPTILERLATVAATLRGITFDVDITDELDELDAIVVALTPPPVDPPTPGKPDWMAEGCCGGFVTATKHGPGIETWPGSPDQFWCIGWDPDTQTLDEPANTEDTDGTETVA